MRGDEPGPVVHIKAIFRFSDLELAPDQQIRHRIAMPVHIDKALDVDQTMVQGVDLRHEERQRTQVRPFGGEELARAGVQMSFRGRIHLVAEGARLGVGSGRSANVRPARKLCSIE